MATLRELAEKAERISRYSGQPPEIKVLAQVIVEIIKHQRNLEHDFSVLGEGFSEALQVMKSLQKRIQALERTR
jgi:hypothetical protein